MIDGRCSLEPYTLSQSLYFFSLPRSIPSPLQPVLSSHIESAFPFPSSPCFPSHPPEEVSVGPSCGLSLTRWLTTVLWTAASRMQGHLWILPPSPKGTGCCLEDSSPAARCRCSGRDGFSTRARLVQIVEQFSMQTSGLYWDNSWTSSSLFS